MATIIFEKVSKAFEGKQVLKDLSFQIDSGECFTILGPSGCGKTVILRLIAGFEIPDSGKIIIGDEVVSDRSQGINKTPEERKLGVVFQDYAVWPHKTVMKNVLYPLEMRNTDKNNRDSLALSAIEMVNLNGYEDRLPYQLSGGQQQRVALARALVANSDILLLDEPLTNLDANLREEMRFEIKEIQKNTKSTILYVTHDQDVALAISDRIAIMTPDGDFSQIGNPQEVYEKSNSLFGFRFLGVANIIECSYKNGNTVLALDNHKFIDIDSEYMNLTTQDIFIAGIRPMDIEISLDGDGFDATIIRCTLLGNIVDYIVSIGATKFRVTTQIERAVKEQTILKAGDKCKLTFNEIHWFENNRAYEEVFV